MNRGNLCSTRPGITKNEERQSPVYHAVSGTVTVEGQLLPQGQSQKSGLGPTLDYGLGGKQSHTRSKTVFT
ncbi:hypothetical protein [uncultured Desulfobacter sp.]|uniref:hypothetical protein n=1 Tax=uncultured Desulfobacter sp. TaxID=240139 RepID=UPI0037481D70